MQLTRHTDYALRVLLFLATRNDRLSSIAEIADAYEISRNHLMKVVNELVHADFVHSVRGRSGGIRLAHSAAEINVGKVVRHMEHSLDVVDCESCKILPQCGLRGVLHRAMQAFLQELDQVSLADVGGKPNILGALLAT